MNFHKARVCRGCTLDFRPEVRGQAYCHTCRHIREAERVAALAARPWRLCQQCRIYKQDCCNRRGVCAECRAERRAECEKARLQRAKELRMEHDWEEYNKELPRHLRQPFKLVNLSSLDRGAINADYVVLGGVML